MNWVPWKVDKSYIGEREGNKHESRRFKQGRVAVSKAVVAGIKQRWGKVVANPVDNRDG